MKMAKAQGTFNVYEHVTQSILAAIEAGTVPWRRGWTGRAPGLVLPRRASGEAYRGINVLMLWLQAEQQGYSAPVWMTYKQAQALGAQVRKGERSSTVVKYGTYEAKEMGDQSRAGRKDGSVEQERRAYARAYRVFNAEQIDGLPERYHEGAEPVRDLGTQGDPALMAWFERLGIAIDTSAEPAAYYTPATDRVHMPPIETFYSAAGYFATLSHETAHATKAAHRLNRVHPGPKSEAYPREELVAELAASMVCARLGISCDLANSAAYLAHWVGIMRADNRAIVRAASMAQAACDWMFETAGELSAGSASSLAA